MRDKTKIIKVDLRNHNVVPSAPPPLPIIPDLILQFASPTKVYTVTVPVGEMDKVAEAFTKILTKYGITHKIEERMR